MRIEPKVVVPVSAEAREPKAPAEKATPASVVKLSEAGQASQADAQVAASASATRVAEIRASIRRGAYPIDLDRLAAKIIDDEVIRGANK
jgi:flagellar biosynthesis anti-sigma factor FlgM